eukprot:7287330-Prymnesium_polylepis.1
MCAFAGRGRKSRGGRYGRARHGRGWSWTLSRGQPQADQACALPLCAVRAHPMLVALHVLRPFPTAGTPRCTLPLHATYAVCDKLRLVERHGHIHWHPVSRPAKRTDDVPRN